MVPILAYRMQEKEFGGLSHRARARLREIAQSLGPGKRAHPSIAPSIRSGTRLIRRWGGEVHEVSVTDAGFEYRGKQYGEGITNKEAHHVSGRTQESRCGPASTVGQAEETNGVGQKMEAPR